jgi:hypothetical protein
VKIRVTRNQNGLAMELLQGCLFFKGKIGPEGFEPFSASADSITSCEKAAGASGAESGAFHTENPLDGAFSAVNDPALKVVIKGWSKLSPEGREAITGIIQREEQ